MIAQAILTLLLAGILFYAWWEYVRSPAVGLLAWLAGLAGLYFVWVPSHATRLAEWVGIGRGVDLVIYVWIGISLIVLLNLHLKLRAQMELITALARAVAMLEARRGDWTTQRGCDGTETPQHQQGRLGQDSETGRIV